MTGLFRGILSAAILFAPACGDEAFSPTVENVSGSYQATTLTSTQGNVTTDHLDLGATLTLTLNPDGTTEGRLLGPGLDEGGEDLDIDLAGTWTLADGTVTFDQQGDSFLPSVPFEVERDQLIGEGTFVGTTIRVVLSK